MTTQGSVTRHDVKTEKLPKLHCWSCFESEVAMFLTQNSAKQCSADDQLI